MKSILYQEAISALAPPLLDYSVAPLTSGLIHRSYKVNDKTAGRGILLQQINGTVFNKPELLQRNYELLWQYVRSENIAFTLPQPLKFSGNKLTFIDTRQLYWRAFEFIDGARTYAIADNEVQARAVARTFAGFTASFRSFDPSRLQPPLPGFHDLSLRYGQFQKALHGRQYERLFNAASVIDDLKKRERYVNFYEVLTDSGEFPLRVMHHDAKISNILFEESTGKVICPVDFDTVMAGYFFSDIGDMIRSMACSRDENSKDLEQLFIRKDYYEAILAGYGEGMNKLLTDAEKKYIHYSGLLIIYMQALRFLTDYLAGDVYYRVEHNDQNLDRAVNQMTLLKKLEEFLKDNYHFSA